MSDFASLEDAYQAVDDAAHCDEFPPEAPAVYLPNGASTGEMRMCTGSVALFWSGSDQERADVRLLLASAGSPEEDKWVYFLDGGNWFLADISEVQVGSAPDRRVAIEHLAGALGARYTGADGTYLTVELGSNASPGVIPAPDPRSGVGGKGELFFAGVRAHAPTLTPERIDDRRLLEIGSLACINPDDPEKQRQYRDSVIQNGFTEPEVLVIFTEARVMC